MKYTNKLQYLNLLKYLNYGINKYIIILPPKKHVCIYVRTCTYINEILRGIQGLLIRCSDQFGDWCTCMGSHCVPNVMVTI